MHLTLASYFQNTSWVSCPLTWNTVLFSCLSCLTSSLIIFQIMLGLLVISLKTPYSFASIFIRSSWALHFRQLHFTLSLVISSLLSLFFRVSLLGQNSFLFIVWPLPPFLKSLPCCVFLLTVHCMFSVFMLF